MPDVTVTLTDDLADALTALHSDLKTWADGVVAQAQQDVTNANIRSAREEADAVFEAARSKIVDDGVDFAAAIEQAKKLSLIDRIKIEPVEEAVVKGK